MIVLPNLWIFLTWNGTENDQVLTVLTVRKGVTRYPTWALWHMSRVDCHAVNSRHKFIFFYCTRLLLFVILWILIILILLFLYLFKNKHICKYFLLFSYYLIGNKPFRRFNLHRCCLFRINRCDKHNKWTYLAWYEIFSQ